MSDNISSHDIIIQPYIYILPADTNDLYIMHVLTFKPNDKYIILKLVIVLK